MQDELNGVLCGISVFESFPNISMFPSLFIKALVSHLWYKIRKPWWSCFFLYVQNKQWLIVWLTCPDKIWREIRGGCVRVCMRVRVCACTCVHKCTPNLYIFVGQFRQLTFFLLLQKMSVIFIFKHLFPRKAKEKANKLLTTDTIGRVPSGDANYLPLLHPLENKIDKNWYYCNRGITLLSSPTIWASKIIYSLGLCYFCCLSLCLNNIILLIFWHICLHRHQFVFAHWFMWSIWPMLIMARKMLMGGTRQGPQGLLHGIIHVYDKPMTQVLLFSALLFSGGSWSSEKLRDLLKVT